MLSIKQIRMLQLLDKQVKSCRMCNMHSNGTLVPFWTTSSKYVIINETPGIREIQDNIPLMGAAGQILGKELSRVGMKPEDFLIIHSVQCTPNANILTNRKPTELEVNTCQSYIRKYIKVLNPEKILCLGNYAKYIFTGNLQGVLKQRGVFRETTLQGSDRVYPALFTIHPAYCIYNEIEGKQILRADIELFKNTSFEVKLDWLFSEDEFKI